MGKEVTIYNRNDSDTMSSREIAELTGKRHDNVLADIDNIAQQCENSKVRFQVISDTYTTSGQSRSYKQYLLPRRECEILITGYDVIRRAAVIDRWFELETKQQLQYQKDDIDILLPCFDYLIDRGLMSKRETLDKLRIDELADRLDPEHTKRIALKLTPLENINPPHLREEVKRWREYIEKYYIRDPEALVFLKDFKQLYALHTGESYRSVYAFHDDAMEEVKIKGKQYMKGVKLK